MNIEVMENLIKLHNSTFDIQYSIFNNKRQVPSPEGKSIVKPG
jgi:hypothetical protein